MMKLFDSLFLLQDKMAKKTELSSEITAILLGICKRVLGFYADHRGPRTPRIILI